MSDFLIKQTFHLHILYIKHYVFDIFCLQASLGQSLSHYREPYKLQSLKKMWSKAKYVRQRVSKHKSLFCTTKRDYETEEKKIPHEK